MKVAKKKYSISYLLTCLVMACVLPVWIVATFFLYQISSAKIQHQKQDMSAQAGSLIKRVDEELLKAQAALEALATSPSLRKGDFQEAHRQALELLKSYPGADIIVADRTGQQLLNSFRPFGSPLPKRANMDLVRSIFLTARPNISDLYFGAVTKRPQIGIDVPVIQDGKVLYDLSMTFSCEKISSLLPRETLPDGWYSTVMDRNWIIVARSQEQKRFVGRLAGADLRQKAATASAGNLEVSNSVGTKVMLSFRRSPLSGWAVTVGVPKATAIAGFYRWVGWTIACASLISVIGILTAIGIARKITRSVHALASTALLIGRGEPVTEVIADSVKETSEVARAFVQASELLRLSEERYRTLMTTAPVLVAEVDRNGEILFINRCSEGFESASVVGTSSYEYMNDAGKAVFGAALEKVFLDKTTERFVLQGMGDRGEMRWFETILGPVVLNDAVTSAVQVTTDITERKELQDQLKAVIRDQELVLETAPVGISKMVDRKQVWMNKKVEEMFHYDKKELLYETTRKLYPSQEAYDRLGEKAYPHLALGEMYETEQELVRKDGTIIVVKYCGKAVAPPDLSLGTIWTVEDITERKQAEAFLENAKEMLEQQVLDRTRSLSKEIEERKRIERENNEHQQKLQNLAIELSMAEERERNRIAGELHDQVGQRLILGKMKIDALMDLLPPGESADEAEALEEIIARSIEDIQSLTFQMRPPILANSGLVPALNWLGEELRVNFGLKVELNDDGSQKPMSYEVRSTVFQATRELLLNVIKHAGTNRCTLRLARIDGSLKIVVEDAGTGFTGGVQDQARGKKGGFGLFNVKQRIEYLGGTLSIEGVAAGGTQVTIVVPLEETFS